jgi:hypothetical protein
MTEEKAVKDMNVKELKAKLAEYKAENVRRKLGLFTDKLRDNDTEEYHIYLALMGELMLSTGKIPADKRQDAVNEATRLYGLEAMAWQKYRGE